MVTQHGLPKGRTTTATSTNSTRPPARPSRHSRTASDSPSLPSESPRRNSLPGNTSTFAHEGEDEEEGEEGDGEGEGEEESLNLDSHHTFLDSLDLDSVSTVGSSSIVSAAAAAAADPNSPRIKRLCSDRKRVVPSPKKPYKFERRATAPPERTRSAQSGRSAESRGSIREEEEGESAEESEGEENHHNHHHHQQQQQQQRAKGPIMGLTASPARRRHRVSLSADAPFEKDMEDEVTGSMGVGVRMSVWRKKRLDEAEAVAAAAEEKRKAAAAAAPRSASAGDYNKDDGRKKPLEEVVNGKDRIAGVDANGSPGRIAPPRRVMSTNGLAGGRAVSGLGPKRTEERSNSPEKDKGKPAQNLPAASEAGKAAIAREEARRLRASTVTAPSPPPDKPAKDAAQKERPLSSASLRTNIPRPSSIPNSPIKAKLASCSALASPSRAKSGLGGSSPSPRHERTRSAAGPSGSLQRSTSAASNVSAGSSSTGPQPRLQRSLSGASGPASVAAAASAAANRKERPRDPPTLRAFKPTAVTVAPAPAPIPETSYEDMSRRAGLATPPADDPDSRPGSSHSAIYSPIDPPPAPSAQDQAILDQLATLRKLTRTSPPPSNRSSWSTECSAEEGASSTGTKPRTRRRSSRHHKKDDDAAAAAARVDEIIAEIDSLHRTRESSRLVRSRSFDESSLRIAKETATTPPRPRSAGRGSGAAVLVTPARLFSPDSEMGEFTARLLRSPAVEDYEDLLAADSGNDSMPGNDSIPPKRTLAPEKRTSATLNPPAPAHSSSSSSSTTTVIDALPRPPKEIIIKRETSRPRKETTKIATTTTTTYPPAKQEHDEDDSTDSLDHLISNDQDFSALLHRHSSSSSSSSSSSTSSTTSLLASSTAYAPSPPTAPTRTKAEAHLADRAREKERALHEKLMNRLKTLQLEVHAATQGIEALETWLRSPDDSGTGSGAEGSADIVGRIMAQEDLLRRLKVEDARQKQKQKAGIKMNVWVRRLAIVAGVVALWWVLEEGIYIYRLPPPASKTPYQIRPLPEWGTRPTRFVLNAIHTVLQGPQWIYDTLWWVLGALGTAVCLLWGGAKLLFGFLFSLAAGKASSEVAGTGAVKDVPVPGVKVLVEEERGWRRVEEVEELWGREAEGDAWDLHGVGGDQVIY